MSQSVLSDRSIQLAKLYASCNSFDGSGIMRLATEVDNFRQKYQIESENKRMVIKELDELRQKYSELQAKNKSLELEVSQNRSVTRRLMEERDALRLDLQLFESRDKQIRQALKGGVFDSLTKEDRDCIAFLREPLTRKHSLRFRENVLGIAEEDSENIDYDETNDSLDSDRKSLGHSRLSKHRRSRSANPRTSGRVVTANTKRSRSKATYAVEEEPEFVTPPKKLRDDGTSDSATLSTAAALATTRRPSVRTMKGTMGRRSKSMGNIVSNATPAATRSTLDFRRKCQPMWINLLTEDLPNRRHTFEDAGYSISKCDHCQQKAFPGKIFRCRDCHQEVHRDCQASLACPCVPRNRPSGGARKGKTPSKDISAKPQLANFCTNATPMIPYPVVHCVVSLERRGGLSHQGIYRVPGSVSAVTACYNELTTAKSIPKLDFQDVDVVTEVLKRFLRELRDPLVPRSSREEFIQAAQIMASNQEHGNLNLNRSICELPQPNRDTMAYLFLHWRRVADLSDMNKMPVENLARVLGPTVLGSSAGKIGDLIGTGADMANCERTMLALFKFDDVYWMRFLAHEPSTERPRFQAGCNRLDQSLLGPICSPDVLLKSMRSARKQPRHLGQL